MFGSRTLRTAAIALVLYGILGLGIAVAMVVVGSMIMIGLTFYNDWSQ